MNACVILLFALVVIFSLHSLWRVFSASMISNEMEDCSFNIKEQMNALRLYAEDWDGTLPPAERWMDASTHYQPEEKYYHCPNCPTVKGYGYTFNRNLAGRNQHLENDANQTPLIYDGKDMGRNAHAPGWSGLANPPRHGISYPQNIVGYADGHIMYYPVRSRSAK